jgi:hypothetical protein
VQRAHEGTGHRADGIRVAAEAQGYIARCNAYQSRSFRLYQAADEIKDDCLRLLPVFCFRPA